MVKTWDLKEDSQENEHIKDLNGQSVRTWLWIQAEWYLVFLEVHRKSKLATDNPQLGNHKYHLQMEVPEKLFFAISVCQRKIIKTSDRLSKQGSMNVQPSKSWDLYN